MKKALAVLMLCLFAIAAASAAEPVRFSSELTDIAKDCERTDRGGVKALILICKTPGDYFQGYIVFAQNVSRFGVAHVLRTKHEPVLPIPIRDYRGGSIEWRLADGEPFAVIIPSVDDAGRPGPLLVKGLLAYAPFSIEVALTDSKAPEQARAAADAAYVRPRGRLESR